MLAYLLSMKLVTFLFLFNLYKYFHTYRNMARIVQRTLVRFSGEWYLEIKIHVPGMLRTMGFLPAFSVCIFVSHFSDGEKPGSIILNMFMYLLIPFVCNQFSDLPIFPFGCLPWRVPTPTCSPLDLGACFFVSIDSSIYPRTALIEGRVFLILI